MKRRISTAIAVASIVNMLGVTSVSASMPLKMSSVRGNGDSWTITLENISDEEKTDVALRVGFYDADGRLKKVKNYGKSDIKSGESAQTEVALSSMDFVYADVVKVLAWKDTEPQAEEIYLKGEKIVKPLTDKEMASVWISTENDEVYKNGAECELYNPIYNISGYTYLSVRDMSELLDLAVEWDSENQTILIYSDKHFYGGVIDDITGFYDGEWYYMDASPTIKDNMVIVPFMMIAELFECEVTENDDNIIVYDEKSSLLKMANEKGLISTSFKNKNLMEEITRGEVASLIVNLYEKVTGEEIVIETNPFKDTDDEIVLKAYAINVMMGYEDMNFYAEETIMNSQYLVNMYKLFNALGIEVPEDYSDVDEFDDLTKDSTHWVTDIAYRLKNIGTLNGVMENRLNPESNISRKEAIALIANVYNIVKNNG